MKKGIHPEYKPTTIVCSCGNEIQTRSTQDEIHVEICAVCHPFYTGRQKLVDTAGRVERFKRKYGDVSSDSEEEGEESTEEGTGAPAAAAADTAGGSEVEEAGGEESEELRAPRVMEAGPEADDTDEASDEEEPEEAPESAEAAEG